MAIRPAAELSRTKPIIDLSGSEGNAFVLMGYARRISKEIGLDAKPIIEDMMSGDYDHLIAVFDKHFGDYVDLYHYK